MTDATDSAITALRDSGLRAVFASGNSFPAMMKEGAALPDDVRRVRSDLLPDDEDEVTLALVTEWGDDSAGAPCIREIKTAAQR